MLRISNKNKIIIYIVSYIISCVLLLTDSMLTKGKFNETFALNFKFDFSFWGLAFLVSIPILISIILILNVISNIKLKESKKVWNTKKVFFVSFISIFLSSFLFLLFFYPGTNMNDTLYILHNPIYYSFQYPLIYNLLISFIYELFYGLFDSMNVGLFSVGFIQIIFMSFSISYVIKWVHNEFKKNYLSLMLILYYTFLPIVNNYNSALLRDPIYAAFILLLIPVFYELVKTKGKMLNDDKNIIKIILLFSGVSFSRNNGYFVIIPLILLFFIFFRKNISKVFLILAGYLVLLLVPFFIFEQNEVEQLFQESVAVPMQQLVYTMKYEGLSLEDEKYLNSLVRDGEITDYYCPFNMDCIKWGGYFKNFEFNNEKENFMVVWGENLIPHFESYVKSYLLHTHQLWTFQKSTGKQSYFLKLDIDDKQISFYFNELTSENLFNDTLEYKVEKYYKDFMGYFNTGTCFWIMIFFSLILIIKNKPQYLLIFVAAFLSWITLMIACPLGEAFRYGVYFLYAIPVWLSIVFSINCTNLV